MTSVVGQPVDRVDGPDKVAGRARYAGEFALEGLAYAALVTSTIIRGRITDIEATAASAAPGVLAVISHENAPRLPCHDMRQRPQVDPKSGEQLRVFPGPEVLFSGQPVAVVVAETLEQACHGASLVRVTYAADEADGYAAFAADRGRPPSEPTAKSGRPGDAARGDADAALAAAPVSIDVTYIQPREHHQAIEPHVTIAAWDGDRLTLYDKTQWVTNAAKEIAHMFGLPTENVTVVSPFVGGAFGSGLRTWSHVAIAALAARQVQRPVRVELTRREIHTLVGFRPHTEQRLALGAERDGRLTAIIHEASAQVARYEEYAETTLSPTRKAYSCPNVRTRYRLVDMDINSPCPMRAPGAVTGILGLEMAMDELAVALGMDPIALRRRNFAARDEAKDLPWSSNELEACYREAASRFGWDRRTSEPGSMRDGDVLIGYGMATASYHADRAPASAAATMLADGSVILRSAASDMGPGTYTSMTQIAADALGLPVDLVRFELGDSRMPWAPVHGGSITMASIGNAVAAACRALQDKLIDLARAARQGPFSGLGRQELEPCEGGIRSTRGGGETVGYGELLQGHNLRWVEAEASAKPGNELKDYSSSAFGAICVEIRVDPELGTIRVPRMVGAYDVGRVINPKIARSQCIGGMVGGIGMALLEQAEWDPRFGRVMNSNLAEYLVPVCADVGELEVFFVPSDDTTFNPQGAKGLAEVAICGVAPAIANAVYHATGKRIRELPIVPERLLL